MKTETVTFEPFEKKPKWGRPKGYRERHSVLFKGEPVGIVTKDPMTVKTMRVSDDRQELINSYLFTWAGGETTRHANLRSVRRHVKKEIVTIRPDLVDEVDLTEMDPVEEV